MADDVPPDRPDDHDEEEEGGPVKSFLEHLEDLRWVLIKSAAALFLGFLICLAGGSHVVALLKRPMSKAKISYPGSNAIVTVFLETNKLGVFPLENEAANKLGLGTNRFAAVRLEPVLVDGTNRVIGWEVLTNSEFAQRAQRLDIPIITLDPAAGFMVAFQVAIYAGMGLASPFIFYFVAAFVFPALKMRERYHIYRALVFGLGLFIMGVAFCYFVLLPLVLTASQAYSQWLGFPATQWKADEYISFVCRFMLGMGLGFEMPVILLTLVKIGILSYSLLVKARPYMILINLVLGAFLTTPEVLTQLAMFVPLQALYEVSVWIAWYWERQEKKREAVEASGA